jgi:signal transduction histidine kinase
VGWVRAVSAGGTIAHLQTLAQVAAWREGVEGVAIYLSGRFLEDRRARGRESTNGDGNGEGNDRPPKAGPSAGDALTCVASAGSLTRDDEHALQTALRAFWRVRHVTASPSLAGMAVSRRGEPLGAIVVRSGEGLARAEIEGQVLRPTARLAAGLLAERLIAREGSSQTVLLRALDEVGAAVARSTTDDSLLEAIFEAGLQALHCDTASLFVLDASGDRLRLVAGKNLPPDVQGRTFRLGEGLAGWVAAHGQTVLVPDAGLDPRYQLPNTGLDAPRSLLVVPLRLYGEVIACLSFARRGAGAFHHSDRDLAEKIAVYAAQSLAHARLTKLETQADVLRMRFETLSAVSHDIRTELSQIKLVAKLAQHAQESEDREAYLQQLIGKVDGVSALLNAGLVAARLEAELTRLQTEDLRLSALVESVVKDARLVAGSDREFEICIPSDVVVRADQIQLRRVLMNLLDNAMKYSPPGSPIRVEATPGPDGVAVGVRDEGKGIPPEEQNRIFEPFQRAAGQSGAPGFGLGLYVCWRIVEAHGGRISVESRPGEGSVFRFVLPPAEQLPAQSGRSGDGIAC